MLVPQNSLSRFSKGTHLYVTGPYWYFEVIGLKVHCFSAEMLSKGLLSFLGKLITATALALNTVHKCNSFMNHFREAEQHTVYFAD